MVKKIIYSILIIISIYMGINLYGYKIYAATVPGEETPAFKKDTPTTVDGVIEGAQSFLEKGTGTVKEASLKSTSNFIYNILLGIAMVIAVIVGMIIGIQFMVTSVEEKAKVKEALVPYVVGCIVVFGAFGIWKLAMNILSKW